MSLLGLQFTVVTDCNALRSTFTKKDLVPRFGRWWLQVQELPFEIKYRPKVRIPHVDANRRLPMTEEINQVDITEADWILATQLQDEQLSNVYKILGSNDQTSETKQYFKDYVLQDRKVFRKLPNGKSCGLFLTQRDGR